MKLTPSRRRYALAAVVIVLLSKNLELTSFRTSGKLLHDYTKDLKNVLAPTQAESRPAEEKGTKPGNQTKVVVPLPFPVHLMEQYIQWHSEDSLQASPQNRTFAVAYYSCPHRAGNFINNFLNSLKWAIITNRTLLITYRELAVVCRTTNETSLANSTNTSMSFIMDMEPFTNDSSIDETGNCAPNRRYYNSQQDCDRVIERAAWLPSYEKWSKHPILKNETIVELDFWSTMPRGIPYFAAMSNPWQDGNERHAGVDAKSNLRLVQFPTMYAQDDYLAQLRFRTYLLKARWSRLVARDLYAEGQSFLYGMLYRNSFSPTAITRRFHEGQNNETTFTVGLHSRHTVKSMDGGRIGQEQRCLSRVFNARYNNTIYSSCKVYLMSDRELTLKRLSGFVRKTLACEPVIADHREDESLLTEHGPFAGTGFFEDMELLAKGTQHGFVGTSTTSTNFILSAIVYDKFMRHWNARAGQKLESLEVCRFRRGVKG